MSRIELFVPCLVREFLPQIGIATIKVLEYLGYEVHFDPHQVCCGQPLINWGRLNEAAHIAGKFLEVFAGKGVVVGPSASCVSAVRNKYPVLPLNQVKRALWEDLRKRLFSLEEFLIREGHLIKGKLNQRVVVHRSCHLLRDLGLDPLEFPFWKDIEGLKLLAPEGLVECCGFGGVFSVKVPHVSDALGRRVVKRLLELEPDVIAVPDAGCILQIQAVLEGMRVFLPVKHHAEILLEAIHGTAL